MILITAAMMPEASPVIKEFSLKSTNDSVARMWSDGNILLALTGIGRENAASVTAYAITKAGNITGALNIGSAGSLDSSITSGTAVVINEFLSASSGKAIVPDILFPHGLRECGLRTYDSIVSGAPEEKNTATDEEAYGFASAARMFLSADRVQSVKIISDNASKGEVVSLADLSEALSKGMDNVFSFIRLFSEYCSREPEKVPGIIASVADKISAKLDISFTMKHQLTEAVHNSFVTYNSVPDISLVPAPEKHGKKGSAAIFSKLLSDIESNVNCISCNSDDAPRKELRRSSFFRHTYVEKDILDSPEVSSILARLPGTQVVPVPHYKSVFNRPKQDKAAQSCARNLILAKADGTLIYKGSDYCNAFGFDKFYYCSTVLGCVYSCEYCYLQGMYPSSFITAFINTRDFFSAIEDVDDGSPMLVCCSYDSDIVALDGILGTVEKWLDFAEKHSNITFEIRTKSAGILPFDRDPVKNVIIAYTVSPDGADRRFETSSPPVTARLSAAEALATRGWRIRFCMEPILAPIVPAEKYYDLADRLISFGEKYPVEDIVLGEFRMNKPYYAAIAKQKPCSALFHSPFASENSGAVILEEAKELSSQLFCYMNNKSRIKVIKF